MPRGGGGGGLPRLGSPCNGRNLAMQEGRAIRRGEGAGEAGKGAALGVIDPPAVVYFNHIETDQQVQAIA